MHTVHQVKEALATAQQELRDTQHAADVLEIEKLQSRTEIAEAEPADIVDPSHYSIQQEKIQAEEDRRKAEAEKMKMTFRDKIDAIRADFEALLRQNAALPAGEQLPRDELEIDPGLRVILEKEADEKVCFLSMRLLA
jgi:hypothetical protein